MSARDMLVYVSQGAHGAASAQGLHADDRPRYLAATYSLQSYDRLERFLEAHADEIADGAPVVDLVPISDRDDLVRLAWDAPLCDATLTDDEVERWQGAEHARDPFGVSLILAGNYFGAAGVAAVSSTTSGDEVGPFDRVSPWRLARYWQGFGARVGVWDAAAGAVVWSGVTS